MKRSPLLLVVISLLLVVPTARAVMIGFFPGLDKLIEQADAIVILRIETHEGDILDPTLYSTHNCYIYQSLKGDIPINKRITLRLMDTRSEFQPPFGLMSTHLMFLRKTKDEPTEYRTLQVQGANVRLSPFGHEKLPEGETVKDRVIALIKSAAAYRKKEYEKEQAFLEDLQKEQEDPMDLSERRKKE
jgi:hypothetical protein